MRKNKTPKEPSLFRKIVEIYYEQAKRRKAIKILEQQKWSYEFLSYVLVKASKDAGTPLTLELTDAGGSKMTLSYDSALKTASVDNIFDHLDDDLAVERYIRQNSRR